MKTCKHACSYLKTQTQCALLLLLSAFALGGHLDLPARCSEYSDLLKFIDKDLSTWTDAGGISKELNRWSLNNNSYGAPRPAKGVAFGVYEGQVYVLSRKSPRSLRNWGHHVMLWSVYLRTIQDVVSTLGKQYVPNLEAVIETTDRPIRLKGEGTEFPVLRFCKTPAHSDIMVSEKQGMQFS